MRRKAILEESVARRLAVQASVAPRTIQKIAAGLPVRGLAGHRARAALRAARLLPELRSDRVEPFRS
jgi:hypothetical protein